MKTVLKAACLAVACASGLQAVNAQTIDKSTKIGDGVYELVFNEKNGLVYVATTRGNTETPTIYALDGKTLAVKDSIVLETGVFGLGINQKTQTLYGTATRAGTVVAVDIKTGKTLATIENGRGEGHTREVVVDEKNNKVYVSDVGGGIWEIDGKTNTHLGQLNGAGPSVTGITLDSKNNKLFAINFQTSTIVAIDLKTKNVLDSFASGGQKAINLDFDAKRNRLYVAHSGSGTLSVLDAATGEVLKSIETGEGALGVRYSPKDDVVYVANRGAQTVTLVNAKDYSVKANLQAGSLPNTVVIDPSGVAYTSHKANGVGRPKPGEAPKRSDDPNGDIISRIAL